MSLDALRAVDMETLLDVVDLVVDFGIGLVWKPVFRLDVSPAILELGHHGDKVVEMGDAVIPVALALDKLCEFHVPHARGSECVRGDVDAQVHPEMGCEDGSSRATQGMPRHLLSC